MKRTTVVIALWAMVGVAAQAQKPGSEQQLAKEADSYFESGNYLKAYPIYSQLVSLYSQNPEYAYRFGACAIYSDPDKSKGIPYLLSATRKDVKDPLAWYYLGKAYHLNYQFTEAVAAYEKFLTKSDPKSAAKLNTQREIETCIYGSNLLSNIKDLQVMNKVEADRANFFRFMDLEGIGGKILAVPEALQTALDKKSGQPGVMHYPGNSSTIYFSSYGKDGSTGKDIYRSNMLPDGKFSTPELLQGGVNTRYDEDFCFMQRDGKTLYFASKGHNSMGGYDIFKSTYDPTTDTFGPAINLDFAINTPDDDIFFIADSLNRRAYFASGRSSDQDHLHVYHVNVQGIPLQLVYLKGEFISEIDNEQKAAMIQVKDESTGRIVMEGNSDLTSGNYLLYVEKPGAYSIYVRTENSPVVHQAEMEIPAFDKPVALRQEIRLVNMNGQEKIVVSNYFDAPLEENMASLAAAMLREKSHLEINSEETELPEIVAEQTLSIEKKMSNATLAAGFAEDVTLDKVLADMKDEVAKAQALAADASKKYDNAYAYASIKQNEAEAALSKAEMIRESTGNLTSKEDIELARQSVALIADAERLKRESRSAVMAAEALKNQSDRESAKSQELKSNIEVIEKARAEDNFDAAVAELTREKERQNKLREGSPAPSDELSAQAQKLETDMHKSEERLATLREQEKQLTAQVKNAENNLANAKKKSDQIAAETEYVNLKSDLESKRRLIVEEMIRTSQLGESTKDAFASIDLYNRLSTDPELGMPASELKPLDPSQHGALTMKLNAMDSRIQALEISDPQTLALITGGSVPAPENTPRQPVSNDLLTRRESAMKKFDGNSPVIAEAKKSVLSVQMEETEARIIALEKKKSSGFTSEDKAELDALIAHRGALQTDIAAISVPTATVSEEQLRSTFQAVNPDYNNRVQEINSKSGTELERTIERVKLKTSVLTALKEVRASNAASMMSESNPERLAELVRLNQQYDAAVSALDAEITDIRTYRGAYEEGNREIMNSNLSLSAKLDSQIALTETYIQTLTSLEKDENDKLAYESDQKRSESIRLQIGMLKKEIDAASSRLAGYRQDRELATTASEPELTNVSASSESMVSADTQSASAQLEKLKTDAETIKSAFEASEETESIFAYESDHFQDLVSAYNAGNGKLKNMEEASEVQKEILQLESEISAETNQSKQRKLDRKVEDLYFKKAQLELVNASSIQEMSVAEYGKALEAARQFEANNSDLINSRAMVRDEVSKFISQAESDFREAQALRAKAPSLEDDIEKNDHYRRAFAKETHATELLRQVAQMEEQLSVLTAYSDDQLTELRYGSAENIVSAEAPEAGLQKNVVSDAPAPIQLPTVITADFKLNIPKGASKHIVNELAKGNTDVLVEVQPSTETNLVEETTKSSPSVQPETNGSNVSLKAVSEAQNESSDVVISESAMPVNDSGQKETTTESPSNEIIEKTMNPMDSAPAMAEHVAAIPTETARVSVASLSAPASAAGRAEAGEYSAEEAMSYDYAFPSELKKELFRMTGSPVYSESRPIPIDAEMPKGVYYKVQVGAFRNRIPQNLFGDFAPVSGESLSTGVTRYTAGFFLDYSNADDAKMTIRRLGYGDAFVVAFRDGKRIPLYEAMGVTETDYLAAVEKEYIYGDGGEAPSGKSAGLTKTPAAPGSTASTANSMVSNPAASAPAVKRTDYYAGVPDAAPVVLVEQVEGLFFTVQVGVYSKPTPARTMRNISPLNSELTPSNKIRYTSGTFTQLGEAVAKRDEARSLGIDDAFITAYYNGERITLSEADRLLQEMGPSILYKK